MSNEPLPNKPAPRQERLGCLTLWLWLIIILNIVGAALTALAPSLIDIPALPGWYLPVSLVATVLVVISAAALLRWKVWGFWGLVTMEGISVLISIAESGNYLSIFGAILGVGILVVLLNMGGEKKAWNQLE